MSGQPDFERMEEEYKKVTDADVAPVKPVIPYLRVNVSPWMHERVQHFVSEPDSVKKFLSELRNQNPILSRPALCVTFLRRHGGLYPQAQTFLDQNNRGSFFVWYTLAERYDYSTWCIDRAEGVLRRGARAEVIHAFHGNIPEDGEKVAQRFQMYSEMIERDPTGISLMGYQIRRKLRDLFDFPDPEKRTSFFEVHYPTALLACMYAEELYKDVYPLTES